MVWVSERKDVLSGLFFVLALAAWRSPVIRNVRTLPETENIDDWMGAEAHVRQAKPALEGR